MVASLASATSATTPDAALILAVVSALAATFVAVALYFYLPSTRWCARWFVRRTRRRISRSRAFLRFGCVGRPLQVVDVIVVVACRTCFGIYAGFFLFFAVPILLTIGAFWIAASIVS